MMVPLFTHGATVAPLTAMGTIMLIDEYREGRKPIWPHDAPSWIVRSDWLVWPVLAIEGDELHIIAIASARPGAFCDLLSATAKAQMLPVIVCPIGPIMPGLMRKWKWVRTVHGSHATRREEWRPPAATH